MQSEIHVERVISENNPASVPRAMVRVELEHAAVFCSSWVNTELHFVDTDANKHVVHCMVVIEAQQLY